MVEGAGKIIERVGSAGMARQLHPLPGGEIGKDILAGFFDLRLDLSDLRFEGNAGMLLQVIQLSLQLDNRLLEIEIMLHTRCRSVGGWSRCRNGQSFRRQSDAEVLDLSPMFFLV